MPVKGSGCLGLVWKTESLPILFLRVPYYHYIRYARMYLKNLYQLILLRPFLITIIRECTPKNPIPMNIVKAPILSLLNGRKAVVANVIVIR